MNLRKKNTRLAVGLGVFALGLYLYAIYRVMTSTGLT